MGARPVELLENQPDARSKRRGDRSTAGIRTEASNPKLGHLLSAGARCREPGGAKRYCLSPIVLIIMIAGPWAIWQDRADTDRCIRWARECWEALRPFYEPTAYVNAVDDAIGDDDERVRSAYGSNFERLTSLKNRYDPTNLFRLNANIRPTV